jgi:hypothetical protein
MNTELNFCHACDMAFLSQTGKLNIIGIFEHINSDTYPFRYPRITLVMNITLETGKHPFKIRLVKTDDSKEAIRQVEGELNCKKAGRSGIINEFLDVPVEKPGEYAFEIWVDNEPSGKVAFQVQKIPKQQS